MSKSKPTNAELTAEVTRLNRELEESFLAKQGADPTVAPAGQPAYGYAEGLDHDASIYERLIGIGSDVGAMEKRDVQNFKAFVIDDVYSKLRPLFTKWGVAILPEVRNVDYIIHEREGESPIIDAQVSIVYRFASPDGEIAVMTCAAMGRDWGDKATNKAVQMAFKYGLIQMFMVSTGEVDPDEEDIQLPTTQARQQPQRQRPAPAKKQESQEDLLLKQVKDHAWLLTADMEDPDYRIEETKLIVEQELAAYGRNPQDSADAQAIMANMDAIFEDAAAAEQPDTVEATDGG